MRIFVACCKRQHQNHTILELAAWAHKSREGKQFSINEILTHSIWDASPAFYQLNETQKSKPRFAICGAVMDWADAHPNNCEAKDYYILSCRFNVITAACSSGSLIFSASSPRVSFFQIIYCQLFWSCGLYVTCLLRSIAIPNDGLYCSSNLELIVQKKKTSLNSGQILRKWSHCLFHFWERRARFSKRIFLLLIFFASSPVLFFNSYIISCSEVAASLWLAFCDRSQPPTMEIVLLIKFETHFTKKENCSQLGSNSQKIKSLLLSFLRKKSSLLKNNLPTVNIFRFITIAYFSTDIFSAIMKLQLVSDMLFAIDCNPNDANWATHQNLKLIGQKSQLG